MLRLKTSSSADVTTLIHADVSVSDFVNFYRTPNSKAKLICGKFNPLEKCSLEWRQIVGQIRSKRTVVTHFLHFSLRIAAYLC